VNVKQAMGRWKRMAGMQRAVLFAPVLAMVLGAVACNQSPSLSDGDRASIYGAVARQLYTVDHTFGEPPDFPTVYLVLEEDHEVSASVETTVIADLADLPAVFEWIASRGDVSLNEETGEVKGGGAIFTLGSIELQDDGSVHVAASIYFANLGAGGRTYVLRQANGHWSVVGDTGAIWMS
jgi:hypothetical protein